MRQDEVLAWLVHRRPERPVELAARMDRAVCEMDASSLERSATMADALASAGLALLTKVTMRSDERLDDEQRDSTALELLAADAFVTYAFEAASEDGTEVAPLVHRLLREAA